MVESENETKARNYANMRIQTHAIYGLENPILRTLLDHECQGSLEKLQAMLDQTQENAKKTKAEIFVQELQKLQGTQKLEMDAVQESIRLIKVNLVPFVDKKQVSWSDTFRDEITKQKTPCVIDMLLDVCPSLLDTSSIGNPTRYIERLQKEYAEFEAIYRYDRSIDRSEQRKHGIESVGNVVIKLKRTLSPTT